jgi:hypothetical protein
VQRNAKNAHGAHAAICLSEKEFSNAQIKGGEKLGIWRDATEN